MTRWEADCTEAIHNAAARCQSGCCDFSRVLSGCRTKICRVRGARGSFRHVLRCVTAHHQLIQSVSESIRWSHLFLRAVRLCLTYTCSHTHTHKHTGTREENSLYNFPSVSLRSSPTSCFYCKSYWTVRVYRSAGWRERGVPPLCALGGT